MLLSEYREINISFPKLYQKAKLSTFIYFGLSKVLQFKFLRYIIISIFLDIVQTAMEVYYQYIAPLRNLDTFSFEKFISGWVSFSNRYYYSISNLINKVFKGRSLINLMDINSSFFFKPSIILLIENVRIDKQIT